MKILIVDDDDDSRRFLRRVAERALHEVIEAGNGKDGLALAAELKPDLIISDVLMPVMDGFFLLRELKKEAALRGIPFVFYSATYTGQDDIRLAMSMGADGYIIKPKEPEELWAEIGLALERRKREKHVRACFAATPEEERENLRAHAQAMAFKLEETVAKLREALAAREQSENSLRNKKEELERFFAISFDLFCVAGPGGEFRPLNAAWTRVLGYSEEELRGRKLTELVHPEDLAAAQRALDDLAAQRDVDGLVCRCRSRDGDWTRLEWRARSSGALIYAAVRQLP